MEIRRGDLVLAAVPGDYGKIRPVLVLQDDAFDAVPSVTVLPLTSDLMNFPLFRLDVDATSENGLQRHSQIMVDKAGTVRRDKIGRRIGQLDANTVRAAGIALKQFLGLDE
jgi:mRNA interferase MazF